MNKVNDLPLFDSQACMFVLGATMHQPSILYNENEKYILTVDDFNNKFYSIVFSAIYNLAYEGAHRITPQDIDIYLHSYPTQYEVYQGENGLSLVDMMYETARDFDMAQFNFQYNRIKKFSTLRELKSKGIDIKEFYDDSDYLAGEEEREKAFNKLSVADILGRIRNKIQLVENRNLSKQEVTGQYAAKGIRNLVEDLKTMPEVGLPVEGSILNYTTRGFRKGKMYLYSAPSGGGKTRTMVGNACSLAFPRIENGKIVRPEQLYPVLFVATEMTADEIQTLILSWISGVNEEKLLINNLTDDEVRLINIAIAIMEKYEKNFIIEYIPNPSINSLKSLITNYIINDEIEHIFYDYIFSSVGLIDEFKGINLREDVVLMMLSNTLKEIAATYNVFVMTGTQLNGSWEGKAIRNANMIRGSKAIADKIDVGMIGVRAPDEEIDPVRTYCESMNLPIPNIVIDVYKNRRGKMCDIKIFRRFDYGTCRTRDIVATTNSTYQVIDDIPMFKYELMTEELALYE